MLLLFFTPAAGVNLCDEGLVAGRYATLVEVFGPDPPARLAKKISGDILIFSYRKVIWWRFK
jgi:hypothetical protein